MLQVLTFSGNPERALSATINHWQFSDRMPNQPSEVGTDTLYQRATLCLYPALPCSLKGWALQLGTSRVDHGTCGCLETSFCREVRHDQEGVLCSGPLCIRVAEPALGGTPSWSGELAAHFLLMPGKTKSQVRTTGLTWQEEMQANVFFSVVYEITTVPL